MTEVVKLVTKPAVQSEGCIATLENMLAIAKTGGLIGVAIAGVDIEGYSHTAFEPGENISTLVGSLERLKLRLLTYQDAT